MSLQFVKVTFQGLKDKNTRLLPRVFLVKQGKNFTACARFNLSLTEATLLSSTEVLN